MSPLSEREFDVLQSLAAAGKATSSKTGETDFGAPHSQAVALGNLERAGYIENGGITENGVRALEPYRARRAIFFAAGLGTRMAPVTAETPKPLVRVKGKRIIDTLIDACLATGIDDIVVVRGYLKGQFDELLDTYPNVRMIDNPFFDMHNNISSAYVVRDLLQNAYVFEADLLLHNPSIIKPYHYTSEFLGFPVAETDDWCFAVEDGRIVDQAIGGSNCFQMVGISYWNENDGRRLANDIERAYSSPGGRDLFWEQVPLREFRQDFAVSIRACSADDVTEIDTFQELCALDDSYVAYAPSGDI